MGSKLIYVEDEELIHIKNISLNLLTNIDLQTNLIEHIDPIYKINFQIKPIFNRFYIENKNQVKLNFKLLFFQFVFLLVRSNQCFINLFR
jgi:hypothetical protein